MAKRINLQTEADLARAVVSELQIQGYDTYEEVGRGNRADVVGLRGSLLVVVECKVSMGLAVLDQCCNWFGKAHLIVAATGYARPNLAAERFMRHEGIGHWKVGLDYNSATSVDEKIKPRLWRKAATAELRKLCVPETRSGGEFAKAGTNGGGYFSPFRKTAGELAIVAKENAGITLKDALSLVKHHYASNSSAMSCLPGLIRQGVVKGVRVETENGKLKLYPSERETR